MISPSKQVRSHVSMLSAVLLISSATFFSGTLYADQAYGPIRASDTLSKIVNRYYVGPKRSSIGLMREIVEKNPQAFIRGDMNLIKRNALISLPGNDWLTNEATFAKPSNNAIAQLASTRREAPVTNTDNTLGIQDRLVFLEAERTSLIAQVAELKRDNVRLQERVSQLELESKKSDEQLRLLDAEIIRVTNLLKNSGDAPLSLSDLSHIESLQQHLSDVKTETVRLKGQLTATQLELADNQAQKLKADNAIAQLTLENEQLNAVIREFQPGANYFEEAEVSKKIALFGGKYGLPVWSIVAGGAVLSLMLIALLSTRRKKPKKEVVAVDSGSSSLDLDFENLLESEQAGHERGFTKSLVDEPEENVYKMFDEGSLEMDLKLDMAKAYLELSDFASARSVLTEVIEGGSEHQQRQANRLMAQAA